MHVEISFLTSPQQILNPERLPSHVVFKNKRSYALMFANDEREVFSADINFGIAEEAARNATAESIISVSVGHRRQLPGKKKKCELKRIFSTLFTTRSPNSPKAELKETSFDEICGTSSIQAEQEIDNIYARTEAESMCTTEVTVVTSSDTPLSSDTTSTNNTKTSLLERLTLVSKVFSNSGVLQGDVVSFFNGKKVRDKEWLLRKISELGESSSFALTFNVDPDALLAFKTIHF